jgi:hypothetical protein
MTDVLDVTNQVIALFDKAELTRVQTMFVIEAVRLTIMEDLMRDIISDAKKGHDNLPGVQ